MHGFRHIIRPNLTFFFLFGTSQKSLFSQNFGPVQFCPEKRTLENNLSGPLCIHIFNNGIPACILIASTMFHYLRHIITTFFRFVSIILFEQSLIPMVFIYKLTLINQNLILNASIYELMCLKTNRPCMHTSPRLQYFIKAS